MSAIAEYMHATKDFEVMRAAALWDEKRDEYEAKKYAMEEDEEDDYEEDDEE